jgi:hypothetical protein
LTKKERHWQGENDFVNGSLHCAFRPRKFYVGRLKNNVTVDDWFWFTLEPAEHRSSEV